MNRSKRYKILIAAFALLLFIMAGCGGEGVFLGGGGEVKYRVERTIYLPMEKVRTLNPMISKDEDTYQISKLIYDSLFELDSNLEPQKKLADSFSYSEDKLTLTIDLKKGVKWHDGEELTAADVKFSIDAYINLSYGNETLYSSYVANIKSVSTVKSDIYRVIITFKSPGNVGTENLVFPILPSHQFRRPSDVRQATDAFMPIGTGPYKVISYNNLSKLVLGANNDYYSDAPKNNLEFTIFPQKKDAINLIDIGSISLIINDGMDRDTLISNMNVNTVNFVSNRAEFIAFNMRSALMNDENIRKAVAYAVDSDEIIESAYLKSGIPSNTIYYPYYFGNRDDEELYPYDIDKAAELVAEAGFRDVDGDGYVEDKDGEHISAEILVNSDDQSRVAASQIIKNALDKLSLDTYIIYCDRDEYLSRIAAGEYDMYIGGYAFNERYDLRDILYSGNGNITGYSNQDIDDLLDEMQSGISNAQKADTFQKVNSILEDELPYYCILYKTYGAISTSALEGEVGPLFNNYFKGCGEWVCQYEIPAVVAE